MSSTRCKLCTQGRDEEIGAEIIFSLYFFSYIYAFENTGCHKLKKSYRKIKYLLLLFVNIFH